MSLSLDIHPVWPAAFTAFFISPAKNTTGSYSLTQSAERIVLSDGTRDHLCSALHNNTACTQLTVAGFRFLDFPALDECCKCCSYASGSYECGGPLGPQWVSNMTGNLSALRQTRTVVVTSSNSAFPAVHHCRGWGVRRLVLAARERSVCVRAVVRRWVRAHEHTCTHMFVCACNTGLTPSARDSLRRRLRPEVGRLPPLELRWTGWASQLLLPVCEERDSLRTRRPQLPAHTRAKSRRPILFRPSHIQHVGGSRILHRAEALLRRGILRGRRMCDRPRHPPLKAKANSSSSSGRPGGSCVRARLFCGRVGPALTGWKVPARFNYHLFYTFKYCFSAL